MVKRNCKICGNSFNVSKSVIDRGCGLYCSPKCFGLSERKRTKIVCLYCNKEFETIHSKVGRKKYCSKNCFYKGRTRPKGLKYEIKTENPTWFKKGQLPWCTGTKGEMIAWNKGMKGLHFSPETEFKKGYGEKEKNVNWKGGASFELYGEEFNNILKEKIRKRDNYTCQECGIKQYALNYKLHIHHIDYNKKNNSERNLISLCRDCHMQTNWDRDDWKMYYREKIGNQ